MTTPLNSKLLPQVLTFIQIIIKTITTVASRNRIPRPILPPDHPKSSQTNLLHLFKCTKDEGLKEIIKNGSQTTHESRQREGPEEHPAAWQCA